jgi:MoxR-like ATPase
MEGTYPLPEAQLDRFLVKLLVGFSSLDDLKEILGRTTDAGAARPEKVMDGARVEEAKRLVREVVAAPPLKDYIGRLVLATHPGSPHATALTTKFVRFGASPRGAQALVLTAKVFALLDGRFNAAFEDVRRAARPCLRHRVILNFEGEAEGLTTDRVIDQVLEEVPTVEKAAAAK